MKATALALLLTACAGCALFRASPVVRPAIPGELVIADEVVQNVFEIQAEYERETVRCLTGFVMADTVFVTGIAPTWINRADSVSVGFRGCTALGTVGWYHNHPGWTDEQGVRQSACWIEDMDVRTLRGLSNFLVAVITCDPDYTLVWKFKNSNVNYRYSYWPGDRYRIGAEAPATRPELGSRTLPTRP